MPSARRHLEPKRFAETRPFLHADLIVLQRRSVGGATMGILVPAGTDSGHVEAPANSPGSWPGLSRPPRSKPHVVAIILPKSPHCGLADPALLRCGSAAAHLDQRRLVGGAGDAALDEAGGRPVLHGDEAGRPDQIGLSQPQLGERIVIGCKSEAGPYQLGLVETAGYYAAHGKAIADLLQHEAWKHREDLQPDAVAEFIDVLQQHVRRLQRIALVGGT